MNASPFPPVPEILPSGVRGALMFLFAVLFALIAACGSQDSGDSASAAESVMAAAVPWVSCMWAAME